MMSLKRRHHLFVFREESIKCFLVFLVLRGHTIFRQNPSGCFQRRVLSGQKGLQKLHEGLAKKGCR